MSLVTRFDTPASLEDIPKTSPKYEEWREKWHTFLADAISAETGAANGGAFYNPAKVDVKIAGEKTMVWMGFPRRVLLPKYRDSKVKAYQEADVLRQNRDHPQDEYFEWYVHSSRGKITKVTFVTELHDYFDRSRNDDPNLDEFINAVSEQPHDQTVENLLMLCEDGSANGVGFDPSYRPDRHAPEPGQNVKFVTDFYSEKYADVSADFFVCKMTLEHIQPTAQFMATVRRAVGDREADIYFMIPETLRILEDCAFEDVYYEHVSYFTPPSLHRLFTENIHTDSAIQAGSYVEKSRYRRNLIRESYESC